MSSAEYEQKLAALVAGKLTLETEKSNWEEEKLLMKNTQKFESIIHLNIGAMKYSTSLSTVTSQPESMLGAMFSGRHTLTTADDYHFIDRDGHHFRHILNFLRDPSYVVGITGSDLN